MSDPVFFERGNSLTIEEIVALTGARPRAGRDLAIRDVADWARAGPGDVTFVETSRSVEGLAMCQASACFVPANLSIAVPSHICALEVDEPFSAFVSVAAALYPKATTRASIYETKGIAGNALVHSSARLEPGVNVDPAAVVGPHAEIGAGTIIGPLAVIGPGVCIGRDCAIGAGVSITNALIGDRVVIQPGCRIGQEGFGRSSDSAPAAETPHLGRVIVQDKVHIGANCAIDRGCYRDTVIGEGTWIEGLVPVASDIVIGRFCRIVQDRVSSGSPMPGNLLEENPAADHVVMSAAAVGSGEAARMNRI